MSDHKNKGFIALISVVFISAILLLIAITLSTSTFYERYDILGAELKEKSLSNAEACADIGLLLIANGESHLGTTTEQVTPYDNCKLGPIPSSGNPRIYYATASVNGYTTNLKISVNPATFSINSWQEIGTY